jgi:murein DD-endopeptidase MepM/ murein hydrolase activator NlpD
MIPARLHLLLKGALLVTLAAGVVAFAVLAAACSSGSKKEAKAPAATSTSAPKATAKATATVAPTSTSTTEPTVPAEPTSVPPTDTPAATPLAEQQPPPVSTPVDAPQIQLSAPVIGQGETTTIRIRGYFASSATASCDGRNYLLVADGDSFWGVIGAAGDAETGVHAITVRLSDANGDAIGQLATQVTVVDMGYPVENIDLPAEVNNSLDPALIQQENDARASTFAQFTAQKLWSGPFIWPVAEVIVSPYGIRRSYNGGPVNSFHQGIDLAADEGVPVAAGNSGRVAYVGSGPTHGNSVLIDHGDGVFSGYNHMSAFNVQVGQMVNKGDIVGFVGSTGMATGPHVHWEILVRGLPVDPVPWTLQSVDP